MLKLNLFPSTDNKVESFFKKEKKMKGSRNGFWC